MHEQTHVCTVAESKHTSTRLHMDKVHLAEAQPGLRNGRVAPAKVACAYDILQATRALQSKLSEACKLSASRRAESHNQNLKSDASLCGLAAKECCCNRFNAYVLVRTLLISMYAICVWVSTERV